MRTALTPGERDLATIAQLAHGAAGHTGIALRCRDEECQETMGEILDIVRKGLLADATKGDGAGR